MDWNKVNTLLSVIHQGAAAGPKFQKWVAAAAEELEKLWPTPAQEAPAEEPEAPEDDAVTFTGDTAPTGNGRRF